MGVLYRAEDTMLGRSVILKFLWGDLANLHNWCALILVSLGLVVFPSASYAQSTEATVTGQITDQSGLVVPEVRVVLTNVNTNVQYPTETSRVGIYRLVALPPGVYRADVSNQGFRSMVKRDIELHVQDNTSLDFVLQIGSVSETVTVEAGAPTVNTQDAAVSTVVDRNFAENMPLNGRSFQSLIELAPGVTLARTYSTSPGQFSVNGQRTDANYFSIDGVSGNIGITQGSDGSLGTAGAGALPAVSTDGGTNNLVAVDAMQE